MSVKSSESKIELKAPDGVSVPGILAHSEGQCIGQVLMLHGITTNKNEFAECFTRVAKRLASAGIASLRIDFRGHGDSRESTRQFSVASQVVDTLAAVKWCLRTSGLSTIHLLGCSFGGPPAIYAAQLQPSIVGSVNLISPVLDYKATFLRPSTDWATSIFNSQTLRAAEEYGFLEMTPTFRIDIKLLVEMSILEPYEALRRIEQSTLIVHGEADSMVPCNISQRYAAGLRHVRLLTIPRMDHGFTDEGDELGYGDLSEANLCRITDEVLTHIRGRT